MHAMLVRRSSGIHTTQCLYTVMGPQLHVASHMYTCIVFPVDRDYVHMFCVSILLHELLVVGYLVHCVLFGICIRYRGTTVSY